MMVKLQLFSVPNKPSQLIFRVKFGLMLVKIFIFQLGVNFCKKKKLRELYCLKKTQKRKAKGPGIVERYMVV